MEEKYKKFNKYNWEDSREWKQYYNNLFPTPTGNKIEKYKKKFYKLKIDADFDVNYIPQEEQTSPSSSSTSSSSNTTNNTSYNHHQYSQYKYESSNSIPAINSAVLINIETLVMVIFCFSIPFNYHTLKFSALALIIRAIRFCGKPQKTTEYAQQLISNDNIQMLVYSFILFIDKYNYYLIVPLIIAFVEYIFTNIKTLNIPSFTPLMGLIDKILSKREEIIQCRSHVELANGFLMLIGILYKTNSFLLPLLYWQFLKLKYMINPITQNSFSTLNQYANEIKNLPNIPNIIKTIIDKIQWCFEYMGTIEIPKEYKEQQGENQNKIGCKIF